MAICGECWCVFLTSFPRDPNNVACMTSVSCFFLFGFSLVFEVSLSPSIFPLFVLPLVIFPGYVATDTPFVVLQMQRL